MSKTFIKFLEEQDKDAILYIGTKEGSGWIVIDEVSKVLDKIDELDKVLHENCVNILKNAQLSIYRQPSKIVSIQMELSLQFKEDDTKKVEELNDKLDKAENDYINKFILRKKYTDYLSKWIHVKDRKILEIYEHTTDISGICVILEGIETGKLWWKGEHKDII